MRHYCIRFLYVAAMCMMVCIGRMAWVSGHTVYPQAYPGLSVEVWGGAFSYSEKNGFSLCSEEARKVTFVFRNTSSETLRFHLAGWVCKDIELSPDAEEAVSLTMGGDWHVMLKQ